MKMYCLKCNKKFNSAHRCFNRLCPRCKQDNKHIFVGNSACLPNNRSSKRSSVSS